MDNERWQSFKEATHRLTMKVSFFGQHSSDVSVKTTA